MVKAVIAEKMNSTTATVNTTRSGRVKLAECELLVIAAVNPNANVTSTPEVVINTIARCSKDALTSQTRRSSSPMNARAPA
jgi:hypothetical protein